MFSFIKQIFSLYGIFSYLVIALFLAFFYIGTIPPYFLFLIIIVAFMISTLYYDDKNLVNRFNVSLPVSKGTIVKSRYLFSIIVSIILIAYQAVLMLLLPLILGETSHYIYDWRDIVILISLTMLITSVMMPIYYMFQSFAIATIILFFLSSICGYFVLDHFVSLLDMGEVIIFNEMDPGFPILVETYIPFQPYIILSIVSVFIFYMSMKGSEKILSLKDV